MLELPSGLHRRGASSGERRPRRALQPAPRPFRDRVEPHSWRVSCVTKFISKSCDATDEGGGRDAAAATGIREAIVADPERWRRATRTGAFANRLELGGDQLKRVPPWADPEHRFAEDLKRKDFFGWAKLSEKDVVGAGFVDDYAQVCRAAAPLMRFLCGALEVPY